MSDLFNQSGADFSPCGKYRYKLWRIWDETKPKAMCIGLNPSTANAMKPDPTITNLKTALAHLGFGGFYMTNLFAWISSKPAELLTCKDPLGDNDKVLAEVRNLCDEVIFCWGNFPQAAERIVQVAPRFEGARCFGFNQNGTPFHPLAMMYKGTVHSPQLVDYK